MASKLGQKQAYQRLRLAWAVLILLVSACGIQVEVVPQTVIPPSPTPLPSYGGGDGLTRGIAAPRLTFSGNSGVRAELFMQPSLSDVYMLAGKFIWISAEYDATWFDAPQGNARLRVSLYSRPTAEAVWTAINANDRELVAQSAPSNQRDYVGAGFSPEQSGTSQLRVEVNLTTYAPEGEVNSLADSRELHLTVFSVPTEAFDSTPEGLRPTFGTLEVNRPFWDWRAWRANPCDEGLNLPDAIQTEIAQACEAFQAGEFAPAAEAMALAADQFPIGDDLSRLILQAAMRDLAGMLWAHSEMYDKAVTTFSQAMETWQTLDRAYEFAISRHNLAAAKALARPADVPAAIELLIQVHELRIQLGDEAGAILARANRGYLARNRDFLYETRWYFEGNSLPHLAIIDQWFALIESGQ